MQYIHDEKHTFSDLDKNDNGIGKLVAKPFGRECQEPKKITEPHTIDNSLFSEQRTRDYFEVLTAIVVFSGVRNFQEIGQSTSARNLAKIGKSNLKYSFII